MEKTDCGCHCISDITRAALKLEKDRGERIIWQTSLMSALLSGVYEGKTTIGDLLQHGDFGLGTFNRLDGEMIAFNSDVFQLRGDGTARPAKPEQQTPFAVMTYFNPTHEYHFTEPHSRQQIHEIIDQTLSSENLFCALRIDGVFEKVDTRTVTEQQRPYKPMLEATEQQPIFHLHHQPGVLIGFLTPAYMQGINVAGYHEHFINQQRSSGGHVLDYHVSEGRLTFGSVERLIIDFPDDQEFRQADLDPEDLNEAIHSVEG